VDSFDHVLLTGPVDEELVREMRELTDVRVIEGNRGVTEAGPSVTKAGPSVTEAG